MYVKYYIKMEDLKDGYHYKNIARNARYGIWRSKSQGFIISRIKFGSNYTFEEHHYDCEGFATAQPIEEIEKSPFNIENSLGKFKDATDREFYQYPIDMDEKAVIEYLNKFEDADDGRDYLKPAHENPKWLKEMIERVRKEREETS